jgi:hypothetical protein
MTKKITKSEYLRDVANTRLELEAHEKLRDGNAVLAKLPETTSVNRLRYEQLSWTHGSWAIQCREFLERLEAMDINQFEDDEDGLQV